MSCCWLQGVKITWFNGLERTHIRKVGIRGILGKSEGGPLSEMLNFSYLGKGLGDLRIPGTLLFDRDHLLKRDRRASKPVQ